MTDIDPTMADYPDSGPDSLGSGLSAAALLRRFQLCADSGGSFLKFSGVSPSVFEEFYTLLAGRGRVTYFGAANGLLFVKMPTLQHEVVATKTMDAAQRQMPAKDILRVGSARYESDRNISAKEADDGIIAMPRLLAGATVPSFVLEVANSQSLADAREAIQWWFQNSSPNDPRGGVQCGLIAKVGDAKLGEIMFELWRRDSRRPKKAYLRLTSQQQPSQKPNPDL